jgi:hypothetical protein
MKSSAVGGLLNFYFCALHFEFFPILSAPFIETDVSGQDNRRKICRPDG